MAKKQEQEQQPIQNPFDQMMFGPTHHRSNLFQNPNFHNQGQDQQTNDEESFDLFGTAQTMVNTYQQLSPYVKEVSNLIKKFKA